VLQLALRSAAQNGGFERVVLHHDAALEDEPGWSGLAGTPGFESRKIDEDSLLWAHCGGRLRRIYAAMRRPNARANVLRAAILHGEGGVYLDLDTVTVRSLSDLRGRCAAFCGVEHVNWPGEVVEGRRPLAFAARLGPAVLRTALRAWPGGWRAFRAVEGLYPSAANNAVLGAVPGHPLLRRMLEAMAETPPERARRPYALGTHLLQRVLREGDVGDVTLLPPATFYPLPPVISEHWFCFTRKVELDEVLRPETRVVHWYASVRTAKIVPKIDADYVRRNCRRQLFCALALSTVENRPFGAPAASERA
jgi:hypothetical protein